MAGRRRTATTPTEVVRDDGVEPPTKPLSTKGRFGTAVGAAMLGFEQALRNEPPAEIMAAEHMPERGRTGDDGRLIIEFPDPPDAMDRPAR
jgi:hypothetical protein